MLKGYDTFRALSPSCPCDLLALKDGEVLRVEVRTVKRRPDGAIYAQFRAQDAGRSDVYAFVDVVGNAVHYRRVDPALPETTP